MQDRNYKLYQDYYDGEHVAQLPSDKLTQLKRYTGFRANICDVITDALAERLTITGYTATNVTEAQAQAIAARLSYLWQANRLDADQTTVHTEAVLLGDSYILVDYDAVNQRPRASYNPAGAIEVEYEDVTNRTIARATKIWTTGNYRRKNVYYANRVERYYAALDTEAWAPFEADEQPAVIAWVDRAKQPLGVPVFHFRNKPNGKCYGRSELLNVIPLQDAINKTLVDLLMVLDTQGWPQRWVRGQRPPAGWTVAPGTVWTSIDPNFSAGELSSAAPDGLLMALERLINIAAGRSRTPQHLFHIEGDYPSGESLKTAEQGLVGKALDRQATFGNCWEDIALLWLRLDNTFGTGYSWPTSTVLLTAVWRDPETKNNLMNAQAISTKAPWLSHRQILREFGYTAEQVEVILTEFEQDKLNANALGSQLIDAFNAGALPGDTGEPAPAGAAEPGKQAANRNPDR